MQVKEFRRDVIKLCVQHVSLGMAGLGENASAAAAAAKAAAPAPVSKAAAVSLAAKGGGKGGAGPSAAPFPALPPAPVEEHVPEGGEADHAGGVGAAIALDASGGAGGALVGGGGVLAAMASAASMYGETLKAAAAAKRKELEEARRAAKAFDKQIKADDRKRAKLLKRVAGLSEHDWNLLVGERAVQVTAKGHIFSHLI